MSIADMVAESIRRLRLEPSAPVERVVAAVTHYYSDKVRRQVLRLVRAQLVVK